MQNPKIAHRHYWLEASFDLSLGPIQISKQRKALHLGKEALGGHVM